MLPYEAANLEIRRIHEATIPTTFQTSVITLNAGSIVPLPNSPLACRTRIYFSFTGTVINSVYIGIGTAAVNKGINLVASAAAPNREFACGPTALWFGTSASTIAVVTVVEAGSAMGATT